MRVRAACKGEAEGGGGSCGGYYGNRNSDDV